MEQSKSFRANGFSKQLKNFTYFHMYKLSSYIPYLEPDKPTYIVHFYFFNNHTLLNCCQ
jgi:hypothetical protein